MSFKFSSPWALLFALAMVLVGSVGCERKEEVLDIETPNSKIEVDRNIDTNEIEVDAD